MNILILDVETTTSNEGNPFDRTNRLVCVGLKSDEIRIYYDIYDQDKPTIQVIQHHVNNADLLVLFNAKFDLNWLAKIGVDTFGKRIWDCQLAEFLLNDQSTPYPSLDQAAEKYGFDKKLDVVKTEYWEKNIDTDQVPREILSDYLAQDLKLTEQVYLKQKELFETTAAHKYKLFKLQCLDLQVLREMEWNGIYFDVEAATKESENVQKQIEEVYQELTPYFQGCPINLGSNDHVSCLLYGGTVLVDDRIPVGVYKSGTRVGETRYKILIREFVFPRLVEPLPKTELKKEGYWSTDDKTLRSLKTNKETKKILELLKKYSELSKLNSTYLVGYPKRIEKMHWSKNMMHGTLNQCVAVTGRLSSSNPNLQNADPISKKFMVSRYQ